MKKILITGGAGYIGSLLTTELVNRKYDVTVIDLLKYNTDSLNHLLFHKNFKLIKDTVFNKKLLKLHIKRNDIIIPLAALVGAPLCEKYKTLSKKTNLENIKFIINNLNRKQKIIYPTTNSGYGIGQKNNFCTEETPLNPISLYGLTKVQAEKEVLKYKNSICFRLATVFGYSYRMRSDLLVNNFVFMAVKKNNINLYEENFRRNFIHIRDVVNVFLFSIDNFNKLKGQTYNVGLSSANITKYQLAKKIKKFYPKLKIKIKNNKKDPDKRDYFVSNKKIEKMGFKARISLDTGIKELLKIFKTSKSKLLNNY